MKAQDLKNSILQLAIQGKLVAQDANDEPAEVLYAKIQAEKQKLIKEGKIKKDKPLPPITDDEIPFEIPSTWKWVRIGDLEEINLGFTYKPEYVAEGIDFLSVKDITKGKVDFSNTKKVSQRTYDEAAYGSKPHKGDILFGRVCSIGNPQIVETDKPFCIFVSLGFFRDHTNILNKKYICLWMESLFFYQQVNDNVKGAAQKNLNTSWLCKFLIPLPPLAEQKRIVAKIEELEPLVKQYDKAETELSALNDSFPEQLKKSILQYAIQGKLVAQNANDEPAEVLYVKIQAEKQKLIKEGKIKKDKPLPPITDDEIPFAIPSTWKWVRLGDCYDVRDGTHDTPKYVSTGVPLVTSKNLSNGTLDLSNVKFISLEDAKKIDERSKVDRNDILFAMIGTIGNPVIVDVDPNFCIKNMALIKYNKFMDTNYILYLLIKAQDDMKKEAQGAVQSFVSLSFIRKFPIPLPPLAEQHRIVAKVNELLQYCEELTHPEKRKEVEPITIEWLIDKGFDSCKQNGYTDVNAILDELNIAVMQDRNLKKGRIEYDNNKKKFQIWVNDLNDNWTKTHELVHYVNDNNEIKLYGAVGRKDETSLSKTKERNVDALTAEILMPEDIFVSTVEQDNIKKYAFVDNAVIRKLGKQFRVSDDAVKIRLQNLGYHTK